MENIDFPWLPALYRAEVEWRNSEALPPDEIAFNPADIDLPEAKTILGYRLRVDDTVEPGTIAFRRVETTVTHVETRRVHFERTTSFP